MRRKKGEERLYILVEINCFQKHPPDTTPASSMNYEPELLNIYSFV